MGIISKFIIMNKIEIFQNPDFGQVRVFIENDEPLFVGADIANLLGYKDVTKAITRHVEEDDRTKRPVSDNQGVIRDSWLINESGLYSLIFSSELQSAKYFKKWVTSEVLPAIRKHGSYSLVPKTLPEALRAYAAEVEKNILLEEKTKQQTLLIEELQPKADYCDEILRTTNCLTVRKIAKDYGMTAQELNKKLNEISIQYKQGNT